MVLNINAVKLDRLKALVTYGLITLRTNRSAIKITLNLLKTQVFITLYWLQHDITHHNMLAVSTKHTLLNSKPNVEPRWGEAAARPLSATITTSIGSELVQCSAHMKHGHGIRFGMVKLPEIVIKWWFFWIAHPAYYIYTIFICDYAATNANQLTNSLCRTNKWKAMATRRDLLWEGDLVYDGDENSARKYV